MKGMKLANSHCIVRQKVKTPRITVTIQLWNKCSHCISIFSGHVQTHVKTVCTPMCYIADANHTVQI